MWFMFQQQELQSKKRRKTREGVNITTMKVIMKVI